MKVRITKIKGGVLPDGFTIKGNGMLPRVMSNYYVSPVTYASHDLDSKNTPRFHDDMNMFITSLVTWVCETDYGFIFSSGNALWKWEPIK